MLRFFFVRVLVVSCTAFVFVIASVKVGLRECGIPGYIHLHFGCSYNCVSDFGIQIIS